MTIVEFSLRLFLETVSPDVLRLLLNELQLPDIAAIFDMEIDESIPNDERSKIIYDAIEKAIDETEEKKRDEVIQIFYSIKAATKTEIDEQRIAEYVSRNIPEALDMKPVGVEFLNSHDYAALAWIKEGHGLGSHWKNIQWNIFDTTMLARKKSYLIPDGTINENNKEGIDAFRNDIEAYITKQQRRPVTVQFEISRYEAEKIRYTIYFSRDGQTHMEFDEYRNLVPRPDKGAGIISLVYFKNDGQLNIKDVGGSKRKKAIANSFAKNILGSKVESVRELDIDLNKAAHLGVNPRLGGVQYVQGATVSYLRLKVDQGELGFKSSEIYSDIIDVMKERFFLDVKNDILFEVWIDIQFSPGLRLKSPIKTLKLTRGRFEINSKNKKVQNAVHELIYDVWKLA